MNIFIMNRYISKSYTRNKNTIHRAGAAVVSTITSYGNNLIICILIVHFFGFKLKNNSIVSFQYVHKQLFVQAELPAIQVRECENKIAKLH